MAPPIPRLNGSRSTWAPRSAATPAVRSVDPSSTTTTSKPGSKSRISSITRPTVTSSFSAGTMAMRFSSSSCSVTGAHRRTQADELEDLARTVRVGVLVEDALARPAPHRLGRTRVREQLAVRLQCLVARGDDAQLGPDVEPGLDSLVRARHDGRARSRQLERPAGAGRIRPR